MLQVHQGSTNDLLNRIVTPGDEPVTLVIPQLPAAPVLDQVVIVSRQRGRKLRIVTSLHGNGPVLTRRQLDSLIRLCNLGVKVKTTDRGVLPSLLIAPPDGCCILPHDWGWGMSTWQYPVILGMESASELFELGEKIWKQAGTFYSVRKLGIAKRWLEDIEGDIYNEDEADATATDGVKLAELTLFDKRRGRIRSGEKKNLSAWWTFQGTSTDRENPFMPIRIWAARKGAHRIIRFPSGRRPTGVKSGDDVFFVVLSRNPGGDAESYIVGRANAVAYRPLIDDASDEEREVDPFLERFPHAIRLEDVHFIRGVVGEGIPIKKLMNKLGAQLFESTLKNYQLKRGNIDPQKSILQKSIIRLADKGSLETHSLLDERMSLLGCVTSPEIERYEDN